METIESIRKQIDGINNLSIDELVDIVADKLVKYPIIKGKAGFNIYEAYDQLVPEKFKNDPVFLRALCAKQPIFIRKLFNKITSIDKDLIFIIIKDNIEKIKTGVFSVDFSELPIYMCEYISKLDPEFRPKDFRFSLDKVQFIEKTYNSKLFNKLYIRYGMSYNEIHKDKNIDLNDKVLFMYNMLNSNVLENIYKEDYYTINDIESINSFLNYLEDDYFNLRSKYPTDTIRHNMEMYRRKYAAMELDLYNRFISYKDDKEKLSNLIQSLGIKKDKIFDYIKNKKYWSKMQKQFISTLLSSYFKTGDVLSIYDVIDLLDEMQERNMTKEEILKEKNIDVRYFDKIYAICKEKNPALFEYIQAKFESNKARGLKKLIMLYHSIMRSDINDLDEFKEKYKRTPEETLELFKSFVFYDNVYNKLSSWYNFNDVEDDKKRVAL